MKRVNPNLIAVLVRPLWGLADDEAEVVTYRSLSPDDERAYRAIIRERLKPAFDRFKERDRAECKISLGYYLSKPDFRFDRIMDSNLLPFDPPTEPRNLFLWFWEECFGSENYIVDDLNDYTEVDDIYQPNLM
jgi:hypothetical protein